MKRLIIFIALFTCFLGAKAEWVEDYRIDYSKYSGFPFYVMGYVPEWNDGVMTDYGAMYTYKTEAEEGDNVVGSVSTNNGTEYQKILLTEPGWHQYFIATDIPTEIGGSYIVKAKVKASEPCEIRVSLKWGWGDGECIDIPIYLYSDTEEVEWTVRGVGGTSCNIVAQPGISTATIEWQYVTVGHETGEQPQLVDVYNIAYQDYSGFPFYVMGYVPEWNDGVMTDYGAMYTYKTEDDVEDNDDVVGSVSTNNGTEYQKILLTEPGWHQYFIATDIPTEIGGSYIVKAKVKASEPCEIQVSLKWGWGPGECIDIPIHIGPDTDEVEWTVNNVGGTSCNIVAQPGISTATIEWKWLTVSYQAASIEIKPNPTVIVVNGLERDYTLSEMEGGTGNAWDNQFWIVANRVLDAGEETIVEFDYVATKDAKTSTFTYALPGAYIHYAAIGDVDFTTEEQHFSGKYIVPAEADGSDAQSIGFNMAVIKEACCYTIKNVIWKTADGTESLINQQGAENFYVKEGAGGDIHLYDPLAVEDATLYVGADVAMLKGETNILPIKMTSREEITGLQFDLELPNGFDLSRVALSGYNSETHSVSRNVLDDGSIRFIVVSQENEILSDTEDGLLNLSIYVDENLAIGQLPVTLKNAQFTTTDYKTLNSTDKTFIVNVKDAFMMGDVNGDGYVNVTDVVLIIDQILEKNPKNFNAAAADVNFDGYINVTDVVLVIDAILGKTDLNRAAAMENVNDMAAVVGMPAQLNLAGDVAVSLTNPTAYTAFQMDVTLPMGVSLEKAQLTARGTDSHQVSVSQTGEGRYRIVGFSTENEPLNGHSGDLLNMSLLSNGQTSGTMAINNVIFVTPEGTQHLLNGIESFGGTTGIADVSGKKSDVSGDIYDLQGRSVNGKTSKNVYIINGNKYFTK